MHFLGLLTAATVLAGTTVARPSGKPTGGPASATITVYSGPYTCSDPNTPPVSGQAGTTASVAVAENQCAIINIPFGGVVTASMTATPKTGTAGCYVEIFTQQGCGVTLQNQFHGFPFNGITLGSSVACVQPPVQSYGAVSLLCV